MALELNQDANGGQIDVSVGELFSVCLTENPTTGYRWDIATESSPAIRVTRDSFHSESGTVGAPGVREWRFQAEEPGTHSLALVEKRSWQNHPLGTFNVTVVAT